jgi:hypothetical protein
MAGTDGGGASSETCASQKAVPPTASAGQIGTEYAAVNGPDVGGMICE